MKKFENLVIDAGFTYPLFIEDEYIAAQRPLKFSIAAAYTGSPFTVSGHIGVSFGGWTKFKRPGMVFPDGVLNVDGDDPNDPQFGWATPPTPYYLSNYGLIDYGFTLNLSAAAGYALSFATLGVEFALAYGAKDKVTLNNPYAPEGNFPGRNPEYDNERLSTGFGAWIMKNIGAASIKAGVAVSVPVKNRNVRNQNEVLDTFILDQYEKGPLIITIPIVFGYWL